MITALIPKLLYIYFLLLKKIFIFMLITKNHFNDRSFEMNFLSEQLFWLF